MAIYQEYIGSQGGKWLGSDDTYTGLINEDNWLYGDVTEDLFGRAKGGDDTLTGGDNSAYDLNYLYLYGDANSMYDHAQGGNDTLTGGANRERNDLYGDAFQMYDHTQGGDDTLTGGADSTYSYLWGDAYVMYDRAQGGDDTLISGDGSQYNELYGDALFMYDSAQGGDDILISGTGDDDMWGDASVMEDKAQGGSDTFVFADDNGNDTIYDFEQGKDLIDLSAFGATIFADLDSNNNGYLDDGDDYVSVAGSNTVIDLGEANGGTAGEDTVTVAGVTGLTDADFLV